MLHSARSKAAWANHNILCLNENINRFVQDGLGVSGIYVDRNTGQHFHQFRAKPFPIRIELWVGDIIRNLRDALDHACSEAVRNAGGSDKRVVFPVAETPKELEGTVNGKKALIKPACPEVVRVILDEIQPTKTGNYTLWAMNQLQNADKHRALAIVVTYFVVPLPNFFTTDNRVFAFNASAVNPNSTSVFPIPPNAEMIDIESNEKLNPPSLNITFGKTEFFGGKKVIPTLENCAKIVSESLDAIERAIS